MRAAEDPGRPVLAGRAACAGDPLARRAIEPRSRASRRPVVVVHGSGSRPDRVRGGPPAAEPAAASSWPGPPATASQPRATCSGGCCSRWRSAGRRRCSRRWVLARRLAGPLRRAARGGRAGWRPASGRCGSSRRARGGRRGRDSINELAEALETSEDSAAGVPALGLPRAAHAADRGPRFGEALADGVSTARPPRGRPGHRRRVRPAGAAGRRPARPGPAGRRRLPPRPVPVDLVDWWPRRPACGGPLCAEAGVAVRADLPAGAGPVTPTRAAPPDPRRTGRERAAGHAGRRPIVLAVHGPTGAARARGPRRRSRPHRRRPPGGLRPVGPVRALPRRTPGRAPAWAWPWSRLWPPGSLHRGRRPRPRGWRLLPDPPPPRPPDNGVSRCRSRGNSVTCADVVGLDQPGDQSLQADREATVRRHAVPEACR